MNTNCGNAHPRAIKAVIARDGVNWLALRAGVATLVRLIERTEPDETGTPHRGGPIGIVAWQRGWRTRLRLDGASGSPPHHLYGMRLSYCVPKPSSAYFSGLAAILTGSAGQSVAKRGSGAGREFRHRASRARPAASQSCGAVFRVPCMEVFAILASSHTALNGMRYTKVL